MRKYGWLALAVLLVVGQNRSAYANEPTAPAPPQAIGVANGAPANNFCPSCSASYAAHGTCAACPKHGALFHRNTCDEGEGKFSRFCHWLFYFPERTCVGCCCNGWIRPQVPFYAYFPCKAGNGSACATCSAGHAQTIEVAHAEGDGGEAQSNGAKASPARISTYKPAAIAPSMPVLSPDQFKLPPPKNACSACQR
jgi:hypothetical protein